MTSDFDLIVIGAGSGGLAAAKRAAKHGAKVAVVEADRVGGTCVVRGCVPKKLMVYAAYHRKYLENSFSYGFSVPKYSFQSARLLKAVRDEVSRLQELHENLLSKASIELFRGWGCFKDSNTIDIVSLQKSADKISLSADHILISVGGRPSRLNIPGGQLGWTSDDIFDLDHFPESISIIGSGFIACEFACILNELGVDVNLIVRKPFLLSAFDRDIASQLQSSMQSRGIKLFLKEEPAEIIKISDDFKINTKSGKQVTSRSILTAVGRKPSLRGLGLEKISIKTDNDKVLVNEDFSTSVSHIYAIGDVSNKFNLTPVAIEEGRVFADNIFGEAKRTMNYLNIPSAVFSQPELASVGLTEQRAIEIHGTKAIKVYSTQFMSMENSIPKKGSKCYLKLIELLENGRIIGCHMFGEHSAEIIQMASIAISIGATKLDFDRTMALHPTISEEFVTM